MQATLLFLPCDQLGQLNGFSDVCCLHQHRDAKRSAPRMPAQQLVEPTCADAGRSAHRKAMRCCQQKPVEPTCEDSAQLCRGHQSSCHCCLSSRACWTALHSAALRTSRRWSLQGHMRSEALRGAQPLGWAERALQGHHRIEDLSCKDSFGCWRLRLRMGSSMGSSSESPRTRLGSSRRGHPPPRGSRRLLKHAASTVCTRPPKHRP